MSQQLEQILTRKYERIDTYILVSFFCWGGGGGQDLTNSLTRTSFSPVLEFVNQLTLAIKTQIVGHLKLGLNARKMINNNHNNKYNLD